MAGSADGTYEAPITRWDRGFRGEYSISLDHLNGGYVTFWVELPVDLAANRRNHRDFVALQALDEHCHALTAADTHRFEADGPVRVLQTV